MNKMHDSIEKTRKLLSGKLSSEIAWIICRYTEPCATILCVKEFGFTIDKSEAEKILAEKAFEENFLI